ncbi:ferritin [Ignatzschineria sp. RMDPL8A]|uniref:ferritin n=1 Tax=Ignatzschineria sp. RMDPL8A TaxID=2999236 RepID=UPI0016BC48FC|nr:ferritin [Ignatzschineria sp. RMDPL8A]MDG9729219.1 ferritin [Ignatzschineria sp. RMDPL8A]NLD08285.1 ferritin [Xanthomonadaceae bacterium]
MITESMAKLLNEQINHELCSAHVYQQMSAWANFNGFHGAASFLMAQANEERDHMQKIFDYVLLTGHMPILGDMPTINPNFDDLEAIFKQAYAQELNITEKINKITHEAITTHDYSTFEFMQWYIVEQREEEDLFRTILDKFEMLRGEANANYFIDKELAAIRTGAVADVAE